VRRPGSDSKLAKARRPKTAQLKSTNPPKTVHHRSSSADRETQIGRLMGERGKILEQLSETSEVLKAVSSSAGGLQPVFRAADGTYLAFWRGRIVYEKGQFKHFKTEGEAWDYLNRCDAAGKIIP
jgi:hypothetical protein